MNETFVRQPRILFHIDDFGNGGTEIALIAWLQALDAAGLEVNVSVGYPTAELSIWQAGAFPRDAKVHVLAASRWMYTLHEVRRQHRLKGLLKQVEKLLKYGAIRLMMDYRFKRLARHSICIGRAGAIRRHRDSV